jgi:flagellar motor protein MotB
VVPAGVAALSPIASNATEAGRAMNRRVEMVKR